MLFSCRTADLSSVRDKAEAETSAEEDVLSQSNLSEDGDAEEVKDKQLQFSISSRHFRGLLDKGITWKDSLFFPVHRRGKIRFIEEDLGNNGESEFYFLYAFGESAEESEESFLADKRNFIDESLSEKYLLAVYKPVSGQLSLTDIIPLKYRHLLKNFSVYSLSDDSRQRAVSVSFTGEDGISDNFITVSKNGKYSVFSMNNTLTEFNRIEDIDSDGFLEVLRYENLFEEGLGYETFITRFELTDSGFSSAGSLSIVRNLKKFLAVAEKTLESKNIEVFLKQSVPEKKLAELKGRNLSGRSIIRKIFYPVKKENELFPDINVFIKNGNKIDFVFPDIVENPFRFDRDNVYNFTTYVKVSSESRDEAIYIVKIYMNENPFDSPRFSFHVN